MTSRVIMAARRFPKEYVEFLGKYSDLEEKLREFLSFRQTHLPNEAFGAMDGRITVTTKLRRHHLVHGKAILIYQLYGSELRLIALADHNVMENLKHVLNYHRTLQPHDYYTFNIDDPIPAKPAIVADPIAPQPVEPEVQPEPEAQAEEVQSPVPTNGALNPLWDDKVVQFLQGRQMLFVPRPSRAVVAFVLDREIIAPRGDVLVFDPITPKVYHLSQAEFDVGFQPDARHTTDLGEAFVIAMQPNPVEPSAPVDTPVPTVATVTPEPAIPEPEPEPEPEPVPETPKAATPKAATPKAATPAEMPVRRPTRRNNISARTGRMMATMAHLQWSTRSNKIDTSSLREAMEERDAKAVSTTLFEAQELSLVKKVGPRPGDGRAYYYCLTSTGEKQVKLLGDWPFTAAGRKPPFETRQSIAVPA